MSSKHKRPEPPRRTAPFEFTPQELIGLAGTVELATLAATYIRQHPASELAREFRSTMETEDAPDALRDLRPMMAEARETVRRIAHATGLPLDGIPGWDPKEATRG